jgi:CRP-like cAMP-binding protein
MLSESVIGSLAPHLEPVTLKVRQILYSPDKKIEHLYFLETGICSIVVNLKEGSTVEVGSLGGTVSSDQRCCLEPTVPEMKLSFSLQATVIG